MQLPIHERLLDILLSRLTLDELNEVAFRLCGSLDIFGPTMTKGERAIKLLEYTFKREIIQEFITTLLRYGIDLSDQIDEILKEITEYKIKIRSIEALRIEQFIPIERDVKSQALNIFPHRDPNFIGRSTEISKALHALDPKSSQWIVSLVGGGGFGKTTLAIEIAWRSMDLKYFDMLLWTTAKRRRFRPYYSDVLNVPEDKLARVADLLDQIGKVLIGKEIYALRPDEKEQLILDSLNRYAVLIVIDELEMVNNPKEFVWLLEKLPRSCKAIVTSRQDYPGTSFRLVIKGFDEQDAINFIESESSRYDIPFLPEWKDTKLIKQIHDVTSGSPLIIQWLIGQASIHGSVKTALANVTGTASQDLYGFCFKNSFDFLCPVSQKALYSLLTSTTSFTRKTIADIGQVRIEILLNEILPELKRMFLIESENDRYRIVSATRAFLSQEFATRFNDMSMLWNKASDHYVEFIRSNKNNTVEIEKEYENILGVIDANIEAHYHDNVMCLVDSLAEIQFFIDHGYWQHGLEYGELAIQASIQKNNREMECRFLCRPICSIIYRQKDTDQAIKAASKAIEIAPNNREMARAKWHYALVLREISELSNSKEMLVEALQLAKSTSDHEMVIRIEGSLTSVLRRMKNYDRAERILQRQLKEARETNDEAYLAATQQRLGTLYLVWDKTTQRSRDFLLKSLKLNKELKLYASIAYVYRRLAMVEEKDGNLDLALKYAMKALNALEEFGGGKLVEEMKETYKRLKENQKKSPVS